MSTLALASQVIGFISFSITLLTLLGVYRDVISTMRNAPEDIPILLGNLRQEIEAERIALHHKLRQGDEFDVFLPLQRGRKNDLQVSEVTHLLHATICELWGQFKSLERPFLIRSGTRAEAVRRGDYWGEGDVGEKAPPTPKHERKRDRADRERREAIAREENVGIGPYGPSYYRTDFRHRFIWWQSKSDVIALMDQVQRVQIRRIERDVFETDELVTAVAVPTTRGTTEGVAHLEKGVVVVPAEETAADRRWSEKKKSKKWCVGFDGKAVRIPVGAAAAEVEVEAKSETEVEIKTKVEVEHEVETEVEIRIKIEVEVEVQADAEVEIGIEIELELEIEVQTQSEPESEIEIKLQVQIQTGTSTQATNPNRIAFDHDHAAMRHRGAALDNQNQNQRATPAVAEVAARTSLATLRDFDLATVPVPVREEQQQQQHTMTTDIIPTKSSDRVGMGSTRTSLVVAVVVVVADLPRRQDRTDVPRPHGPIGARARTHAHAQAVMVMRTVTVWRKSAAKKKTKSTREIKEIDLLHARVLVLGLVRSSKGDRIGLDGILVLMGLDIILFLMPLDKTLFLTLALGAIKKRDWADDE